jgi:hypothetical protein
MYRMYLLGCSGVWEKMRDEQHLKALNGREHEFSGRMKGLGLSTRKMHA